jgi:hypothetical protein
MPESSEQARGSFQGAAPFMDEQDARRCLAPRVAQLGRFGALTIPQGRRARHYHGVRDDAASDRTGGASAMPDERGSRSRDAREAYRADDERRARRAEREEEARNARRDDGAGPPIRRCGTMEVHNALLERYPGYGRRLARLGDATRRRMALGDEGRRQGITKIPVVVHVVYHDDADNISREQVESQIDALNRDYRAANPDKSAIPTPWKGLVADPLIEFHLAKTAPDGSATHGDAITRTHTTRTSFRDDDSVKAKETGGVEPWPTDKYLNIWVCRLRGGLLGYAQFPEGPLETDGVVIQTTAFGTQGTVKPPFDMGRTTTHEVGHWLNLRHIWGDDQEDCNLSDYVSDTPNCAGPNYGKPAFPSVTCRNGPNGDMFMNYMDYVDDDTMVMFTDQQVVRMHTALDEARDTIGQDDL